MADTNDRPINTDDDNLALGGHDPVAYFTDDRPVPGDAAITAQHRGATYRFATEANRDTFLTDPDKYAPQYGGFCATAMSEGKAVDANPERYKITDGKLYVFYKTDEDDTYPAWVEDEKTRRSNADTAWNTGEFTGP